MLSGMTRTTCEIADCGRRASSTTNGLATCERCRTGFVSVGWGAVYFDGGWHGVAGAAYTAEQVVAYPGLSVRALEEA